MNACRYSYKYTHIDVEQLIEEYDIIKKAKINFGTLQQFAYLGHAALENAGVAQWQSTSFVTKRLRVRFPSPAPAKTKQVLIQGLFYCPKYEFFKICQYCFLICKGCGCRSIDAFVRKCVICIRMTGNRPNPARFPSFSIRNVEKCQYLPPRHPCNSRPSIDIFQNSMQKRKKSVTRPLHPLKRRRCN